MVMRKNGLVLNLSVSENPKRPADRGDFSYDIEALDSVLFESPIERLRGSALDPAKGGKRRVSELIRGRDTYRARNFFLAPLRILNERW